MANELYRKTRDADEFYGPVAHFEVVIRDESAERAVANWQKLLEVTGWNYAVDDAEREGIVARLRAHAGWLDNTNCNIAADIIGTLADILEGEAKHDAG